MGIASGNPEWEDYPSRKTPQSAQALNNIEDALDRIDGNARAFARIVVVTGTEAREDAEFCVWWDARPNLVVPDDAPINMAEGDEWKIIGDVTVPPPDPDPDPVTAFSIFGATVPGTPELYNDGGGDLYTGMSFYATKPIRVLGVRVWNPVGSDATFLDTDLTVFAYARDWVNSEVLAPTYTSPTASKTHTVTRVAGEWTSVLFDTPITLLAANAAESGSDCVQLAVRYAGGNYYVTLGAPELFGFEPRPSDDDPGVFLAERNFFRGFNSVTGAGGNVNPYGIDLLFEVV